VTTARDLDDGAPPVAGASSNLVRLLTVPQVMAALQISRWCLYQEIRSNRLPTVKIGRCRRISAAALAAYVERLHSEEVL
jgi:excisionase family DNA binding protein